MKKLFLLFLIFVGYISYSQEFVDLKLFDTLAPKFLGKSIIIEGKVDHICRHSGMKFAIMYGNNEELEVEANIVFDTNIVGKNVKVLGILREFRVDEKYCQNLENSAQKDTNEVKRNKKLSVAKEYREQMKQQKKDFLSFYWLEFEKFVD